ncbi:unnamed protein product [Clonostachys byssicola]|uniref:Uncharacterized protein n=1 Tax=Clonostachys byssicola TaxID=160290 RepID=A0A9N9U768_9HYPO|nr:unnamed protein product [Clonostachys byssicola]
MKWRATPSAVLLHAALILLLPWYCLAHLAQPLHFPTSFGQPLQCLAKQDHLQSVAGSLISSPFDIPAYQRIRIATGADVDGLMPLLRAYIQEPSLAATVTEIILDIDRWDAKTYTPSTPDQLTKQGVELFSPIFDRGYSAIEDHIHNLELGDELTRDTLYWIRWKIYERTGAWKGPIHLRDEYNSRFAESAAVVLFSICHNISTLYIGYVGPHERPVREYLMKSNYGLLPKPGLQKLRNVIVISGTVCGDMDNTYVTIDVLEYIQYFHRLPAIESFTIDGVQEWEPERTIFVPWTSNMKKIHIGHSAFLAQMFDTILSIPKALEELEISVGGLFLYHGDDVFFHPSRMGKALEAHKKTLRVLDLDIDCGFQFVNPEHWERDGLIDYWGYDWEWFNFHKSVYGDEYFQMDADISSGPVQVLKPKSDRPGTTIGSFHAFYALTHLSISIKAILGYTDPWEPPYELYRLPPSHLIDILPPSLEYLCIYGYILGANPYFDYQIDEFMKHRAKRLPNLKEVWGVDVTVLGASGTYSDWPDDVFWVRPVNRLDWREVSLG